MASEPVSLPKDVCNTTQPEPSGVKMKYRKLRPEELETLRKELEDFDAKMTKISPEETKLKKEIVDWLIDLLKSEIKPKNRIHKLFKAGSAYEKVQAGEANDFDVMVFINVRQGIWEVEDARDKPGFCTIRLKRLRDVSKKGTPKNMPGNIGKAKLAKRSHPLIQILDSKQRLSALKVRKLFTSSVDKILKKKSPLLYESKSNAGKQGTIKVTRKQRGPATTLTIECEALKVAPFTLDLVNSVHYNQIGKVQKAYKECLRARPHDHLNSITNNYQQCFDKRCVCHIQNELQRHKAKNKKRCDFVAKPFDKQQTSSTADVHLWRKSYSREEIKKIKQIDEGNQIHRKMLRIFKILKSHQSQLKCLKSYVYKNVLLQLSNQKEKMWSEKDLPDRFVDMVIALRDCLADRKLPVYCNPEINLLSEYKECQLTRIMGYLRRIANKGLEGYKELLSLKEKEHMQQESDRKKSKKRRKRTKPKKPSKKSKRMTTKKSKRRMYLDDVDDGSEEEYMTESDEEGWGDEDFIGEEEEEEFFENDDEVSTLEEEDEESIFEEDNENGEEEDEESVLAGEDGEINSEGDDEEGILEENNEFSSENGEEDEENALAGEDGKSISEGEDEEGILEEYNEFSPENGEKEDEESVLAGEDGENISEGEDEEGILEENNEFSSENEEEDEENALAGEDGESISEGEDEEGILEENDEFSSENGEEDEESALAGEDGESISEEEDELLWETREEDEESTLDGEDGENREEDDLDDFGDEDCEEDDW